MTSHRRPDWLAIDDAAPDLVLTRNELHELGVTQRMIWARVRHGGPWQRLLPGVIMLRNGAPGQQQLLGGAVRYAGPQAVITGLWAARLHGLKRMPEPDKVHVLLPHDHKRVSSGFVVVERTTRMPEPRRRHGFVVAEAARAVLDATRRMTRRDLVEELIAESVQRGHTTPDRLRKELEAGSCRGTALPRAALQIVEMGARSTAEGDAIRLSAGAGLPQPQWNPSLRTRSGLILPTPDGWFDDVGLAWEIDSLDYHLSPQDYDRTLRRHAILTGVGITVLHTLPSRLRRERQTVTEELRAAYHRAALRPRPDVVVA